MRVSVLIIMGKVTVINERVLAELPGIIASSIFIGTFRTEAIQL